MLRLAHAARCYNCGHQVEGVLCGNEYFLRCECGQLVSLLTSVTAHISGVCRCGAPLDDHIWDQARIQHCP